MKEAEQLPFYEGWSQSWKFSPITQNQVTQYAFASGDLNPIHLDVDKAKKYGLSGTIAHGMLTMGLMSRCFYPYMEKGLFVRRFSTRFLSKVYMGDVLEVHSMCETLNEKNKEYEFQLTCRNQRNEKVAVGNLTMKMF